MHLVESAKSGKPLPPVLPANLLPQQFKKTMSESMESENMEGMPGGQIARQRSVSSSSANDELAFLRSGKSKTLRTICLCLCILIKGIAVISLDVWDLCFQKHSKTNVNKTLSEEDWNWTEDVKKWRNRERN